MKKLTQNEIDIEFQRIMNTIEDTDMSDFETVFQAGIDFATNHTKTKSILREYAELGFIINTKHIIKILSGDCDENDGMYDELYGVDNITFSKITFNQHNASNRKMTIIFSAEENRGGTYNNLSIEIDSLGRVVADIDDSPWEGGGVETEIVEIIMKYVAKQKYLK